MKNWIVGGLVFVLISCQQETRNEQTFLSVKDILEIGELITAEYHGEVIKSLSIVIPACDNGNPIICMSFHVYHTIHQKH